LIVQLSRMVLVAMLILPWPAVAYDCSILSTGAAADLAMDDPEAFKTLRAHCAKTGVEPRNAAPRPEETEEPPKNVKAKWLTSKPEEQPEGGERSPKGCPYLIETEIGYYHDPGSRACLDGILRSCDMIGKDDYGKLVYAWHIVSTRGCTGSNIDIRTKELNSANLVRAKKVHDDGG
jgi:hypothetical protein